MKRFLTIFCGLISVMVLAPSAMAEGQLGTEYELMTIDLAADEVQMHEAPFLFQAFAISNPAGAEVRFHDDQGWSEWQQLAYGETEGGSSELVFLPSSDAFALRSSSDTEVEVTLMHLRESVPVASTAQLAFNDLSYLSNPSENFEVLSRNQWGADENLRTYDPDAVDDSTSSGSTSNPCEPMETAYPGQYQLKNQVQYFDNIGRSLIWPQRYSQKVKKIVVHHTARSLRDLNEDGVINVRDYRLAVQAIYTYHTVSNGWGDLGYHYLVDPDGNVYEGRAGGKDVIGAHVLCQNSNTIGIAVLGNFEEDRLSSGAFDGLAKIARHTSELYGINPLGESSFRGTVMPHIVSHAEVGSVTSDFIGRGATACPGNFLKRDMARLRRVVSNGGAKEALAYEVVDGARSSRMKPLEEFSFALELENRGEQRWTSVAISRRRGTEVVYEDRNVLVSPGQGIVLDVPWQAPYKGGRQIINFEVKLNGQLMDETFDVMYTVEDPFPAFRIASIEGAGHALLKGEEREIVLEIENLSNFDWANEGEYQVQIQQVLPRGDGLLVNQRGLALFMPEAVPSRETIELRFDLPPPRALGQYSLELAPVIQRRAEFRGGTIDISLPVEEPQFVAEVKPVAQSARVSRGFEEEELFELVNRSNFLWEKGGVWVQVGRDGEQLFINQDLQPGEAFPFPVMLRSSYTGKSTVVRGFVGVERLPSFLGSQRLKTDRQVFTEEVLTPGRVVLQAEVVEQSTEMVGPQTGEYSVWVDLKNTGTVPWYRDGDEALQLGVHGKGDFAHSTWDGRTVGGFLQDEVVLPGETGRFLITLWHRVELARTTYDHFVPIVDGQRIRMIGKIRFGVEGAAAAVSEEGRGNIFPVFNPNAVPAPEEGAALKPSAAVPAAEPGVSEAVPAEQEEMPPMRVLLTDINQEELKVTSPAAFHTWVSATGTVKEYQGGEEVRVLAEQVQDGTVIRMRAKGAPYFQFTNWDRLRSFGANINDNQFRGVLEFRWDADEERMIVINELPLADYMKGVAEVPESDDQPQEKRKVIAVLARSYALHYLTSDYEKFPGKPYNAADSPAIFQKYIGYSFEGRSPKWQSALEETEGEVVLVDGLRSEVGSQKSESVLRAAYFSCTDGDRTKSWDEVWPENEYFQRFGAVFQSVQDPLGDDPGREGHQACGHQVGLSGYGATQKASNGEGYRDIIESYYTGVEIGRYE